MNFTDLTCIKCEKTFEPAWRDDDQAPPNGGLLFISYDNYGSRLFNSENGNEYLVVIICDECADRAADAGNVMHTKRIRIETGRRELRPWREVRLEQADQAAALDDDLEDDLG